MNNLLPLALSYLQRGWSVIPVGSDKKPLIMWKEFQTRRATEEELVKWFTTNPEAQIGIVTGAISNLTVIDIEKEGDVDLIKDETFRSKTGGDGIHIFYKYDPDFSNAVRLLPFLDVRSEGGYIVAPGSSSQKGAYVALNTLEPIQMPSNTKETLLKAKNTSELASLPWSASSGDIVFTKVSPDSLSYEGSGEGGRNDAMTKFAGAIHAKLHPSLWPTIGYELFQTANVKNSPPLPQHELRTIWASISKKEISSHPGGRQYWSENNNIPKTWGPAPETPVQEETILKPLPKFEDSLGEAVVEDEKIDGKETRHVSDVADLQKIDSSKTYPIDMPPFDEALLGGFSLGELIVIAGKSGHGKTTVVQDWSVTLASGGADGVNEKLPSLWFSYEVLARPLWDKFKLMGASIDTPVYMPVFNETGDIKWVCEVIEGAIAKWGVKVVCIDHLGFLKPPKGNYSSQSDAITHTVRLLKQFAVKHGLIIIMPVHMRKTNSTTPTLEDIKDASGIAQEADTVFFIGREKDAEGLPTDQAKMWLVKNRKSGISVSAMFDFKFGRYYYDITGGASKKASSKKESSMNVADWDDDDF